jgi:hypothetical protein
VFRDYTYYYRIRTEVIEDNKNLGLSVRCIMDIIPAITVTSPNGGENWQVGSSANITWT